MVETRSKTKIVGDEGNASKNRVADGEEKPVSGSTKTDSSDLRRSARNASKQVSASPSTTRKSERLQKQTPPVTPAKGKSGGVQESGTPGPSRRSNRGKKNLPSSSSPSKHPEGESNSSGLKTDDKKEGRLKQRMMESEKVSIRSDLSLLSVGKKRKRMSALTYLVLLKMRLRKGITTGKKKSKRHHKISGAVCSDTRNGESKFVTDEENEDNKCHVYVTGGLTDQLPAQVHVNAKQIFAAACDACSKLRRVGYDSPEVELCSCLSMSSKDGDDLATAKDGFGVEGIVISGSAEEYSSGQSKEAFSDPHMYRNESVCAVCNEGGKSLQCNGKGCKRCYHLPLGSPPIHDIPPGVWYCFWCMKKKFELGVYSVTKGVESIWDTRELDVSGTHKQKQYLVKYIGLAHVHNHWISETQLLLEAPSLVSDFNDKNQVIRWDSRWTVPHRLLKKRLLSFSESPGGCDNLDSGDTSKWQYEWLVKWCALDYENATWELEIANFLCSPHGQSLIKEYWIRQGKRKQDIKKNRKRSPVELSKIAAGSSLQADTNILNYVNRLQDCWCKSQNSAFYADQEQIAMIVLFMLSMSKECWPVLIITTPDAISQWEAEFVKCAPSVDYVVYHGSRENRKNIETLEFYSQRGCIMLQVLLTSIETAVEDIHVLNSMSWDLVVIDQCQHTEVAAHVEQIKTLAGLKVLLFNGQIKHSATQYLNLLSLVDSGGNLDKVDLLESYSNDAAGKLKDRFSCVISCNNKGTPTVFLEYWLPVQISELQLELYCDTLLLNISALCSHSKSDPVGALSDILLNVRKCCDHPYIIMDPSKNPINKGLSQAEILDIGIKASGKLQLLDKMLCEMKRQHLRAVVLFQSLVGSNPSIGDILDDFLRQRFGENSYERVDAIPMRSKKESALNRFNKVENGRFVFLLENRACKTSIKFSSVDNIIIYGSDANPLNDLKLLEKISFDSEHKQIKVFRLYSCFTVEEHTLVMAKQEPNHLNSLSRKLNNSLMWGASDLFSRLDEYHSSDSQTPTVNASTGQLLLSDVTREFSTVISESSKKADVQCSVISKVQHSSSSCTTNLPLFGEQKVKRTGEEPCVFWKNLLEERNPQWRDINRRSPRNRKRAQFFDGPSETPEIGILEGAKKSRKMSSILDSTSIQPECEGGQLSASKKGPSPITVSNELLPTANQNDGKSTKHTSSSQCGLSREVNMVEPAVSDEKSSLHILLKEEMAKVFEVLKLSEDVKEMAGKFLEYVTENHRISRKPSNIFHAFQISACWAAASFLKQKVDKEKTLALTKEHLKFECTEDEAATVYLKLRALKKNFLQHMKRNDSNPDSFKQPEAGKSGDTNEATKEHVGDAVNEEANIIAEKLPKENLTPMDKADLTNIVGNQKGVASNPCDGNQTLPEVTSSDGDLRSQNQCNGTHLSESQSTSHSDRQENSNSEAVLAESGKQKPSSVTGSCPQHDEVASVACNQDNGLQTNDTLPQSVEIGTAIKPSQDGEFQDPLYNEFDRIRGEINDTTKCHEELKSQLSSDCEKEINEAITAIRKKYNARLTEAETTYSLRKGELNTNLKRVLLNKLLADTFRSKCLDAKPLKLPGVPTSFMQHLRQVSQQPTQQQSAPLTGSSSAVRQTSVLPFMRPLLMASSAVRKTSATPCMRPPLMASSSAGEQTSAPACMRPPLMASSSAGQQTSAPACMRPPLMASSSAGQQTSAPACMRPPLMASSSAGEQTSAPAFMRPPLMASSAGEQSSTPTSSTRPPSISLPMSGRQRSLPNNSAPLKSSPVVAEATRRPPIALMRPSIALSSGGQTAVAQTHSPSRSSFIGKSPRIPNRPPIISSITPSSGTPRLGGEIRSPAPHLRPSSSLASKMASSSPSPVLTANIPRMPTPSSPSLNHQVLPKIDPQQPSEPNNRPLFPPVNISLLSATELLRNLDIHASVSSSPSPSAATTDSNPQNQQPSVNNNNNNIMAFSALELLMNVDNQANAKQPSQTGTNLSVAEDDRANLGTMNSFHESSAPASAVVSTDVTDDVVCVPNSED